ncbi:MAG TPA: HEAT repeat domain-containing protein [Tepidisphaeraceae bacterium]|nr:HEAT repeat domain-containing protein [Tepidisphaeraceae bacterium]
MDHDPYAALLAEQSIRPDKDGLVGYLRSVQPTARNRARTALLIEKLSAADFEERELAQRQLVGLPAVAAEDLAAAAESGDTELASRARAVIAARSTGSASASVGVACFRTIAKRKVEGAAGAVLEAMPLYAEEFVLSAARDAVRATATRADLPALRKAAAMGAKLETRVAAVGALASVLETKCAADVRPYLADAEPRVRLAAARALADVGDRACLPALVELLSAPDLRVRNGAAATLRALTGRTSDYVAWVDPAAQASALRAWRDWLSADAQTCALKYPLKATDAELGRTLVCLYARNEVVEFDASGRETFNVTEEGGCPWAAQGLANGRRLVALYSANTIVEYGHDGKSINRIPVPGGPMSVRRLDSGATLVACNNAQKVVEVSDAGKILWEVTLAGGPCDAVRLDNGNTLVTLQNSNAVVEVDPSGREVMRIENLHTPRSASRLDNGNTLVCDLGTGKVMEFDPAGKEVWSQGGFASPFGAQRLPAGTTLVSDTVSVKEIDHTGRVVGENRVQPLGRVWRY